ncbi:MAG: hypothetical protein KC591_10750 [Gemmatimonadetes bacterium]|nr:hypothetical protein [Gemmatimonadota bacterium]
MKLRWILSTAIVGLMASSASAQLVVGSDISGATIYHLDVNTSAATPLLTGVEATAWGMAYDWTTNTLYWNNGSTLYSSPFSLSGLTPTNLGTMSYNGATVNFVGLGFRGGKLLGTRNITTEAVYEIDVNTLQATLLYQYPSAFDFGGIDVDRVSDVLYGLNDSTTGGSGRGLYEIDVPGMSTTLRAPYPAGETDIDGLAAFNGVAYYVTDEPGLFYVYDIASGMQTGVLTSPFTGAAVFSAAAYVEGGTVSIDDTSWGQIKNLYK